MSYQPMTPRWIVRCVSSTIWKVDQRNRHGYYETIATCDCQYDADRIAHAMWERYGEGEQ